MTRTSPDNRILINGSELRAELRADLLSISVCQYLQGGDAFELTVNNLDSDRNRLRWIDGNDFAPGSGVEIELGYADQVHSLISGEITALQAEFPSDEGAVLRVQGFDRTHRLRRGRRTRVYREMKDSQIAERIAGDLGLTPQAEDSGVVHPYVLQNNLSDLDFLLERARRIRYELRVHGHTLVFRPAANHRSAEVALEYMTDLKSFAPRLSTASQAGEVAVRGWDPAAKRGILGVGRPGDESSRMEGATLGPALADAAFGASATAIVDVPVHSQSEADQIAKARFNDIAIELVAGEGEAVGDPRIRAGSTLALKGLGTRFSGDYYVKRAEHRMGPSIGYVTRFSALRNAS